MFDRLMHILPLRLRTLLRRADVERELDEELRDHIERQTAENIRLGMAPAEARTAALRAMGGIEAQKEAVRDTRGTRWLEDTGRDVTLAVRSLRHAPGFAAAVILTLALGIGANTAMFTLLRGTLLKPLPNRDGERLVYLRQTADAVSRDNLTFSVPEVADLRSGARTLSEIAEYSAMPFTFVGADNQPSRAQTGIVSGNYFDVVGLTPVLGRVLRASDDGASAAPVAVLAHHFWSERFGADSGVIGRTVRVNEKSTIIVGVLQPAPHYPQRSDVFVNLVTSPHHLSATMVTGRTHRMTEVFARLAPHTTVEQAREEIGRISANMFRDHPDAYEQAAGYRVSVTPLRDAVNERAALTFWLLMGAAAFVLLIACANVANLTLMRGVAREREMQVRTALGARRLRLRRLLLAENLTLALMGGVLGVAVAYAGVRLLVAFAAQFSPRAAEIRVDATVLGVALATAVLAAVALAFVPRLGGEASASGALLPTGRRTTLGRGRQSFQRTLVVTQLAVCMILLTGAGLLVRTLDKLGAVDSGVRAEHVLTMELPFDGPIEAIFMRRHENLANYERIRERVQQVPGVELAALGSQAPLRNSLLVMELKAEGRVLAPDEPMPRAAFRLVDPLYFDAAGIRLVRGRAFQLTDRGEAAKVVILNESFARRLFGERDPIGQRVAWTGDLLRFTPFTGDWRTVVGVVGDTRDAGLDSEPVPVVYHPFAQEVVIAGALIVRSSTDPAALTPAITRAIREVAPRQLIERVATLEQVRGESVAPRRLNAMFISSFGTLALLIAMVGIAGVLAFAVASRTAEFGIRMSLGANRARVLRMVLREGGTLLGAGLLVGLVGAWFAAQLLQGMLFGVSARDPVTLGGVALVLLAVGLAACLVPAARAARVDPAVALRAD